MILDTDQDIELRARRVAVIENFLNECRPLIENCCKKKLDPDTLYYGGLRNKHLRLWFTFPNNKKIHKDILTELYEDTDDVINSLRNWIDVICFDDVVVKGMERFRQFELTILN